MTGMNADSDHERNQTPRKYENRTKYDFVVAPNDITSMPDFVKICHIITKINGGRSDCMAISHVFFFFFFFLSRKVSMLKMSVFKNLF
jgi:hypothetical protein